MTFKKYKEAEYLINEGLIRRGLSLEREKLPPSRCIDREKKHEAKMVEMKSFLAQSGDPQTGIHTVHVGGTSGKGTVCACVAQILKEAGLKVGLHISPYLQAATEKIWIDGKYVSSDEFYELVKWIWPIAKPRVKPQTPASIHGMASITIALEAFKRHNVDVAVFEVGCGGRYDLSSFVDSSVSVITNVGMDHVVSLGPDISSIAWHKAGIARHGVPLVTGASGEALDVIKKEAQKVAAPLEIVEISSKTQKSNEEVAKKASLEMAKILGVKLKESQLQMGIKKARLPGRFEVVQKSGPRVVLDGAHNADKLEFAINMALDGYEEGPKIAVLGVLGTKAKYDIFSAFENKFDMLIVTEPNVYAKSACPADEVVWRLKELNVETIIERDRKTALDLAFELCKARGLVLVTGSFYLLGEIRDRWYPVQEVVMQQTSWPGN